MIKIIERKRRINKKIIANNCLLEKAVHGIPIEVGKFLGICKKYGNKKDEYYLESLSRLVKIYTIIQFQNDIKEILNNLYEDISENRYVSRMKDTIKEKNKFRWLSYVNQP